MAYYTKSWKDHKARFKNKAAARAATQLVGNSTLVQLLTVQEQNARANCMEYECNQGDHSFFGHPRENTYHSYKPYKSLRR